MKKKIYAVKNGRKIGIFKEWQKCLEQTNKYPNEKFHSFEYCSELEEEPENVPGSLRYAIKAAKEFLGDLVYLGESANCLEDVSWVEDGFLPFGNEPESESQWLIDNRNTLDALGESWEIEYWKIAEDMKKCVEIIKLGRSVTEKQIAALNLKRHLERCLADMKLSDLTVIYKGLKENNAIGYNPHAVAKFVERMANRYPKP